MLMEMIIFAVVFAASLGFMSLFVTYIMMEFMTSKKFWKHYVKKYTDLSLMDFDEEDEEE